MRFRALAPAFIATAIMLAPLATALAQSSTDIPNLPPSSWKPERPIEFVVQAGAGGGSDLFARIMADLMTKEGLVNVPIKVVNKPGGSGAVAYAYVNARRGDPHVIATATSSYLTTPIQGHSPSSYKDFTNVAVLCVEDYVAVVRSESPYKTLKDLVEAARQKPNSIRIGGTSVGSSDSILENRLEKAAGIKLNYIVVQSGGEANAALLGGSVDLAGPNPSEAAPLIAAGRLRPIAMFSPERLENWPNVPTAREQGFDVTLEQHRGVIVTGGITEQQSLYWQNVMAKLFQSDGFKKYMSDNGLRPLLRIGKDAEKYVAEQHQYYAEILTELGIAKKQ
ncbi:tripartite tricarboxylate transporter substrate binding protein [Bradyrhizobium sp. LHD-71]|uniref:Bug family tripartite tricarboxylate transporter substrate binding protein n=1 Tax=Bradyrhizobium sp. LHD-71 TaxID=3072141 RepID=UPI0028105B02|nr:tripartite tricarboxylate transporter substrate binding protein [Bradyrhizobium sp. LHD-71]MDQ8729106.1 tripartite tricarboxylate transporter substrate binding protein [Bradyrhizobium sp. LHD-71]